MQGNAWEVRGLLAAPLTLPVMPVRLFTPAPPGLWLFGPAAAAARLAAAQPRGGAAAAPLLVHGRGSGLGTLSRCVFVGLQSMTRNRNRALHVYVCICIMYRCMFIALHPSLLVESMA
jgi:hypothetical protein